MKTVLHPVHLELGARMVPFGGWDMPVQYSGILAEVKAVRTAAGLFDVSHMGRLYISGAQSTQFLDWVLTGSADALRVGRARYCMICNESGGVIDDTIFYRLAEDSYLLIPNAGNRLRVVEWFQTWIRTKFSGVTMENLVRTAAGLFDVSHMGRLYISGAQSTQFLDWVLTGSADALRVGRARYCMICNESGGVIDDTIFYRLAEDSYLLIPNAGNRLRVVEWFQTWIRTKFSGVTMEDRTETTALIACQGPGAVQIMDSICDGAPSTVRPFAWKEVNLARKPVMIGRTGYTGEDGFEIVAQAQDAALVWNSLTDKGALPCGLGARDVLRLEAGLPLHGHEIDEDTSPIEAGLNRFVRFDKEYVGSTALAQQNQDGTERKLVGLTVQGRSAPRAGYSILRQGEIIGRVTSGSYSPTLDTSIAMGYVLGRHASLGQVVDLDIRGRTVSARIVELPFYTRPR